jgi:hypothetical protein
MNNNLSGFGKRIDSAYQAIVLCFLDMDLGIKEPWFDLKGLHTSPNYLESLPKELFTMLRQIGPPTFFIIFTSAKRLWDLFIKALHTQ